MPAFIDPKTFDWSAGLMEGWETIREETDAFLADHSAQVKPYFNEALVETPGKWKAFGFRFWKLRRSGADACPKTMQILSRIPNLLSASISIMEPHTLIKPHCGDTNAIYRCHLGLNIPAARPLCGFKVGGEERSWEEGGLLVFNDSQEHSAWNETDQRRYVLLFDVIKPEFQHLTNRICAQVWADLVVLQILAARFGRFGRAPHRVKLAAYYLSIPFFWLTVFLKGEGRTAPTTPQG